MLLNSICKIVRGKRKRGRRINNSYYFKLSLNNNKVIRRQIADNI
jgi:hypothetical protein